VEPAAAKSAATVEAAAIAASESRRAGERYSQCDRAE
jgi:hypothetical protein